MMSSDTSNDDCTQHVRKRARTTATMSDAAASSDATAKTTTTAAAASSTTTTNAMLTNAVDVRVDETLESRSMLVYGVESMKKMKRANVFLSGLSGLGVEIGTKGEKGQKCFL
jgi:chloramphenicol 3-O-phosphotransferase